MEDYRILANSAYEANNALILKLKKNKTKQKTQTLQEKKTTDLLEHEIPNS